MKPYQTRLIQEYKDLHEKISKLTQFIEDLKEDKIHYEVKCPLYLFQQQLDVMKEYLDILDARIYVEGIDLRQELPDLPISVSRIDKNCQNQMEV